MYKNIKCAIVTWICYRNFGTHLQAYALQKMILSLGYENHIISDQKIVDLLDTRSLWKRIVVEIYGKIVSSSQMQHGIREVYERYQRFEQIYLLLDRMWKTESDLSEKYDLFICGSDQIWSPILPMEPFYYLAFTEKKKVAYAPSIGQITYPEERRILTKSLIEKFAHLSVREEKGAELLREFIDKPVEVVLDPTLLLPSEEWSKLVGDLKKEKSYVLCYFLTYNVEYLSYVRRFAEEKKMPVKIFIINRKFLPHADVPLFSGPLEFLQEIKGADYFFTDSFHGSIFAIHFEKRFWTFKRFLEDSRNNQNSRVENLFSKLEMESYFIGKSDLGGLSSLPNIDYVRVKSLLSVEREHSLNYLKQSLEN